MYSNLQRACSFMQSTLAITTEKKEGEGWGSKMDPFNYHFWRCFSACLFFCLSARLSVRLFVCVCSSVRLSVSVCSSVFVGLCLFLSLSLLPLNLLSLWPVDPRRVPGPHHGAKNLTKVMPVSATPEAFSTLLLIWVSNEDWSNTITGPAKKKRAHLRAARITICSNYVGLNSSKKLVQKREKDRVAFNYIS